MPLPPLALTLASSGLLVGVARGAEIFMGASAAGLRHVLHPGLHLIMEQTEKTKITF